MEGKAPPFIPANAAQAAASSHSATEEHFDSTLHSYVHILVKRKIVTFIALAAGLLLAVFINLTQIPVYEASTELVIEPKLTGEPGQESAAANLMRDPTFLMTQTRLLRGQKFADRVLANLDSSDQLKLLQSLGRSVPKSRIYNFKPTEKESSVLSAAIQRSVSLGQVASGARILQLSVTGYLPEICASVANAAAEAYVLLNHESHIELFQKRFAMTNRSLSEIREKVKASELALEKVNAEIKLLGALKVFGELYPEVVNLRKNISDLSVQLAESQRSLKQSQLGQRHDMLSLIVKPHLDLDSLTAVDSDLTNLKSLLEQEIDTNREIYNSIYKRIQEMELTGGSDIWVDIKVIQPAGLPSKPVRPNKGMNVLLGLLLGLVAGISLSFFLEYLDSSVRSIDDVKAYLRLTSLGMVPEVEFEAEDLRSMRAEAGSQGLGRIMWSTSDLKIPLYVAEAYRIIRTNFVFGAVDKSLKIFQVTSAVKGEGKTTTTVNLGISLAQVGMRVLIVDADLRRPSLHRALHLEADHAGFQHILTGRASFESVVQKTSIANLSVLISGGIPEHPAELLSSAAMKQFLSHVRNHYDVVLIDSPPVISVADSPVIASHVDGTILVVRAGYIPRRLNLQAKKAIEAVNGKVLGIVLNGVSSDHHPYYYNRYYTDNYYTYGDQKTGKRKGRKKSPMHGDDVGGFEKLRLSLLPFVPEPVRDIFSGREDSRKRRPAREPDNSESELTV